MVSTKALLFLLSAFILLTWVQRISGEDSDSILDMLGKSRLRQKLAVNFTTSNVLLLTIFVRRKGMMYSWFK